MGPAGIKTVIQQILAEAKADSVIDRLRDDLKAKVGRERPGLDVAVYGIINAGKSSLINALPASTAGPIGGTTGRDRRDRRARSAVDVELDGRVDDATVGRGFGCGPACSTRPGLEEVGDDDPVRPRHRGGRPGPTWSSSSSPRT